MFNQNDNIGDILRRDIISTLLERIQRESIKMESEFSEEDEAVSENVEDMLDNPYINRSGVPLAMDIFKPRVSKGTELPVVVTIHGGGLVMGDRRLSRRFGREIAKRGYLVFSIEYRLVPRANVCEQLDDVCAGMDFIGKKLTEFDVDFTRMFLVAESAGAYLATYVAAMKKSKRLQDAIGYEPSRMSFKALGLISGMFYTNRNDPIGIILSEQFYGEKRTDNKFLRYMNPEDPEIIRNLPPAFLVTSNGDFLNNYTIEYHKALEKAGKTTHLVYYGEKELGHAFPTMHPDDPKSQDAIDRMTKWFEDQADAARKKSEKPLGKKQVAVNAKIADGSIIQQKAWKFIKELNSVSDERLDNIALIDGTKQYTYRKMFREWEKRAEVLSALGMTGKNGSRVGLSGFVASDAIFMLYALNMTGAVFSGIPIYCPVGSERWKNLIKKEKITDLILGDLFLTPEILKAVLDCKEELGLKNIILIHSEMKGPFFSKMEAAFNEYNYFCVKQVPGAVFLNELMRKYEATPISYAAPNPEKLAVIIHTSGTTKGINKPIPFTDKAFNASVSRFFNNDAFHMEPGSIVFAPFDLSGAYLLMDQLHLPFACGGTLVVTPLNIFDPKKYMEMLNYYHVNAVFTAADILNIATKLPKQEEMNFSSVEYFAAGGMYISSEKRKRISDFVKEHGSKNGLINGYGLSEAGGACIVSPGDRDDDTIGYALPGVKVKIYDEDEKKYYTVDDGEHSGVLYVSSDSLSSGRIDDEVFFELVEIDGEKYLCTYDMVKVNADKSLTYIGRMNRCFVNNEGIRFDAGLIETAISAEPGIEAAAVVPDYDKRIHDTVPMLFVKTSDKGERAKETVKRALVKVFITDGNFATTNLPCKCSISEEMPYNANGKVDIYRITSGEIKGEILNVMPVRSGETLTDITLEHEEAEDGAPSMAAVPDELKNETIMDGRVFNLGNIGKFMDIMSQKPEQKKTPFGFPQMPFPFPGFPLNNNSQMKK